MARLDGTIDTSKPFQIDVDGTLLQFPAGLPIERAMQRAAEYAYRTAGQAASPEQKQLIRQLQTELSSTGGGQAEPDFSKYPALREKYIKLGLPESALPSPESANQRTIDALTYGTIDEPIRSGAEYVRDVGNAVLEGATAGFGDEAQGLAAGLNAAVRGQDYGAAKDEALAESRSRLDALDPAVRIAANLGGGILAAPVVGPALSGISGAAKTPTLIANLLRSPIAKAAGGGALFGFGSGEGGLPERAESAAVGGLLGGAAGAALRGAGALLSSGAGQRIAGSAVGAGAGALGGEEITGDAAGVGTGAVGGAIAGAAGPRALARQVSALLRRGAPERADTIARLASDAGLTPDLARETLARIENAGGDVTLADVGPSSLRQLSFAAAARPSGPGNEALTRLEDRAAGERGRVVGAVREGLGLSEIPSDAVTARDALLQRRATEAAPLYNAAFDAAPTFESRRVNEIINNPIVQREAVPRAEYIAAGEGRSFNPERRPGDIVSTRSVHDLQQALREEAETQAANGDAGKARVLTNLRRDLLGATEEANPAYNEARVRYAQLSQPIEAFQNASGITERGAGRGFDAIDPDVLRKQFENLSDEGKDAFRLGAFYRVRSLANEVGDQSGSTASTLRKVAGSPEDRERFRIIFGSPSAFEKFQNRVDLENAYRQTNAAVRGGSQTAGRQAAQERLSDLTLGGPLPQLATGDVGSIASKLLRSSVGRGVQQRADQRSAQIADFLLSPVGEEQRQFLSQVASPGTVEAAAPGALSQALRAVRQGAGAAVSNPAVAPIVGELTSALDYQLRRRPR